MNGPCEIGHDVDTPATWLERTTAMEVCDPCRALLVERVDELGPFDWQKMEATPCPT